MRFEIFTVMNTDLVVFWHMTLFGEIGWRQYVALKYTHLPNNVVL